MSSIRPLATILITVFCLIASSFAQNSNSNKDASGADNQVEVKTDRFSGNTTVMMKPQVLVDTPEHKLTMEIVYRLDKKELAEASVIVEEIASVRFDSRSVRSVDFGDRELHFILDGNKQMRIGETSENITQPVLRSSDKDAQGRMPYSSLSSALFISQVEDLARAKNIEMRLGKIELTLNQSILNGIRQFAREFANHAPTRSKKKGAKP